jgi:hypothetical protein
LSQTKGISDPSHKQHTNEQIQRGTPSETSPSRQTDRHQLQVLAQENEREDAAQREDAKDKVMIL